jgi:transcriptional regulator with XRE-family HTH domain
MRSLRLELGMSLDQLSKATGISKGHLSSIEHGFAAITIESVMRIAQGLDLSPTMLLAFPESDEYAVMLDLMRQLPTTRMKPLRKIMRNWIVK